MTKSANTLNGSGSSKRSQRINAVHAYLAVREIKWTPSRVVNFVQKFERHGGGQTLDEFLDAHNPDNFKPYAHPDPTGEDAVWNIRNHQPKGATVMSKSASVKDVAADLGISEGTVRRWLAQGRISGVRIGPKLIRLDLDQVKHELYGTAYSA